MGAAIAGTGLSKRLGTTQALADVTLSVAEGEVVAVVGPSGCGKSTLLQVIATLLAPDEGRVEFEGRSLRGLSDRALSDIRLRRFGFAFQFGELVPELTLRENVELPLRLVGVPLRETRARCTEILDELDIAGQAGRRPNEVSGGQAQRAAIARAMIHRPAVLFADEPTGALDGKSGAAVLDALLGLARSRGTAVLIVTHDQTIADHADRVIEMRDGSVYGESAVTA